MDAVIKIVVAWTMTHTRFFMRGPFAALILTAITSSGVLLSLAGCSRSPDAPLSPTKSHSSKAASQANLPTKSDAPAVRFIELGLAADPLFAYRNGAEVGHCSILESLGGGVAAFDYDGDGLLDLCFPGGGGFSPGPSIHGQPTRLFRNMGSWDFSSMSEPAIGVSASLYTHGVSVGDYDNDGFPDFLLTGYGGVQLWNNRGDGTFAEVSALVGIRHPSWSTGAAWGDFTGDGNLDVYVCSYVNWSFDNHPYCQGPIPQDREICPPREFAPLNDVVFFGNGDGTFRNATEEAGLREGGKGLGVLVCDVDNDGDSDIYVANDTTDNFLYLNDRQGKFQEVGALAGVAVDNQGIPNGSMGLDLCDFNQDGLPDLWVTNYEREPFALYRNEGGVQFLHVSQPSGIAALGGRFVGFGTAFVDFDRDGHEEVVVTNGHVIKFPPFAPRRQLPIVMVNEAGHFRQIEFPSGEYLSTPHEGRGLAVGDFDNNGSQDLVITHLNDPPALLANKTSDPNGWLRVRLIGVVSNRDAVGARLILHTTRGDYRRQITGGGSYLSHNDCRVFWGIPHGSEIRGLSIHWPSGTIQKLTSPSPNTSHVVVETNGLE